MRNGTGESHLLKSKKGVFEEIGGSRKELGVHQQKGSGKHRRQRPH